MVFTVSDSYVLIKAFDADYDLNIITYICKI